MAQYNLHGGIPLNAMKHSYHSGTTSGTAAQTPVAKVLAPNDFKNATNLDVRLVGNAYVAYEAARQIIRNGWTFPTAAATIEAGAATYLKVVRLTDTQYVACYDDGGDSNKGKCVVIDIAGTTVTGSTPVVFNNAATTDVGLCRLSNSTFCVTYCDDGGSDYLCARIGTVTSSVPAFGTEKELVAAAITKTAQTECCEPRSGVIAVAYQLAGDTGGDCIACTYTGTTFGTAGTPAAFDTGAATCISICSHKIGEVCIAYNDGDTTFGTYNIGTVSAAGVVAFGGSAAAWNAAATTSIKISSAMTDRVVVSYIEAGDPIIIAGTNADTVITFGTAVAESATTATNVSHSPLDGTKGALVWCDDAGSDYGKIVRYYISSADAVTFDTTRDFFVESSNKGVTDVALGQNDKVVTVFKNVGASNVTSALCGQYSKRIVDVRSAGTSVAYTARIFPVYDKEGYN